ncbi:hypothetical protein [Leptolyngbya sp. FACHB-261]|uniref:hypothetical protein n=1 Tax=Leptolyngbya sp. FACHB-261 TaxID=2692806 RepID=UPI0016848814|nr:hypothetical protein [Leptolyngbya sp. FACHB-261]MBD2100472.1 hypothetical protein [Leptolyngbya sp. FACHB-261]
MSCIHREMPIRYPDHQPTRPITNSLSEGLATMRKPDLMEIVFHYVNGQHESFSIQDPNESQLPQQVKQNLRQFLREDWWILELPEQTLFINPKNVLKIEIRPGIELEGEGVLKDVRRITALARTR